MYHRGYWPQLIWGERSFADSFPQVTSICYKSVEWLGEQDADLPCQVLTQEKEISRNLAFSPVHPELKQSKYHQKCAHHAPAKTFYRAPRRTAGFSANKNLLVVFFFFLTKRLQRYIETVNRICSVSLCSKRNGWKDVLSQTRKGDIALGLRAWSFPLLGMEMSSFPRRSLGPFPLCSGSPHRAATHPL